MRPAVWRALLRLVGRQRTSWALYSDDSVVECVLTELASGGAEVLFSYRGDLCCASVHPTRRAAEAESQQKRRELVAAGWRPRPAAAAAAPAGSGRA